MLSRSFLVWRGDQQASVLLVASVSTESDFATGIRNFSASAPGFSLQTEGLGLLAYSALSLLTSVTF